MYGKQNHVKLVVRHVWEGYIEKAEDIRHATGNKELYSLRRQTIERVSADEKELHVMRFAAYIFLHLQPQSPDSPAGLLN